MNTLQTELSFDEFKSYLLFYCANADFVEHPD